MNTVTRTVKMYVYTFANLDIKTGETKDVHTFESTEAWTKAQFAETSKSLNGAILVDVKTTSRLYSLPMSEFVAACKNYATKFKKEL